MSQMITILKNFAWITAAAGTYETPWVHYPSELSNCEMITVIECVQAGSVDVHLKSSTDGSTAIAGGTGSAMTTVGAHLDSMTVNGTMVRVKLESSSATLMTISIYLLPKVS